MKRILVVDDIAENRYLLEAMLRAYGCEVITANDGAEALASARRQPPDLVISDILMPVMDGFVLCRLWHADESLRGIPFMFYTATYTDARDELLAMDLGADRFVIKPQEPQVMIVIIQEVLARGAKPPAVAVSLPPRTGESDTLREYNEVLVRKLEKKVTELEAAREALEAENRQRHRVEEALRRSEERWRLIYETEPECVKVISAEGLLVAMNPAGLAMIDAHSLDQVCGKSLLDLVTPEHRDAYQAMHRDVIAGQSRRIVLEVVGLKGTRRWLETHAVPLRNADGTTSLLGVTRDITDRKRIEEALRESRVMLQLVLDSIPQGVFWKDRNSVYLGANRVALDTVGLGESESIVGLTNSQLPSPTPEEAEHFTLKDREVMDSNRPQFGIVETVTRPDGSTIWLEVNKLPLHDAHGRVIGLLGTCQNITERKRADDELRASRERLQVLSRQLLNAQEAERRHIARELHDQIGQSLTAMKLNLKALQPTARETSAHTILHETIAIVDQTLEQVRNLSLDLRPSMLDDLGLAAALRWYLDRQARRAGFAVQFTAESRDSGVSKEIETTCFRVAQEIVTNIARHAHARHVRMELRQLDTELELFVQDDGVGFDLAEVRERTTRGTSLGLLGMQERVLIAGGRLDLQSAPSRGTEVRVRFPLRPAAPDVEPVELEE